MRSAERYDAMRAAGLPHELAAELDVNIGDIRTAAEEMDDMLLGLGRTRDGDLNVAFLIESEAIDHLPHHLKSLRKAAKQLRRLAERKTDYTGATPDLADE